MAISTTIKIIGAASLFLAAGVQANDTDKAADPDRPVIFQPISSTDFSILPRVEGLPFEGKLSNVFAVFKDGDDYVLMYNDIVGDWPPTDSNVTFATSKDLETWTRHEVALFKGDDTDYGDLGDVVPVGSSIVALEGGGYRIYFDAIQKSDGGPIGLGMAEADTLKGPWRVHPELVFKHAEGTWYDQAVAAPSIIRDGDRWRMYYMGVSSGAPEGKGPVTAIGIAESNDGIHWTPRADPVFGHGEVGQWDGYKVDSARLIRYHDGYLMLYRSDDGESASWDGNSGIGIATSDDGYHWERIQAGPVISENDIANWYTVWGASLFYDEAADRLHLFVEYDGPPRYGTRINHSIHDGPLK